MQLHVISLEGAVSGGWPRPAGRLESSHVQGPFMAICYELCSSQARFGDEPPSLDVLACSWVLDWQLAFPDLPWYGNGAARACPLCGALAWMWKGTRFRNEEIGGRHLDWQGECEDTLLTSVPFCRLELIAAKAPHRASVRLNKERAC